ncbi:ADP-ribosylglycohydrolase family protein [Egicoccus sp. AB-alg2]|uniref:ADP-ribosylglycohydrolase family protein n=1 Tax=Egicoccus sp. AB-alg2 TaxID=3242693 RepID=UPI00359E229E
MTKSALFEKVYGSIAAANIGSAMGAAVEWVSVPGGGWQAIEEAFGWVDGFLPWVQQERDVRYWNNSPRLRYQHMDMPPGMTEDGAEVRYLLTLAMLEKPGRVTVEDVAEIFARDIVRDDIGRLVNPHIKIHLDRLRAGDEQTRIPPRLLGALTPWPGLVDAAHMIGPVGIINAGDPYQAALDAGDVALLLQPAASGGVEACKLVAAATAEAFSPTASVDSIIGAALDNVSVTTREIVEETLEIARKYPDMRDIREPIRQHFAPTYPYADAVETAAEALALLWVSQGDVREAIVGATNLGRDTDCIAGCLGQIVGAYGGIGDVPSDWTETVQAALDANDYTLQTTPMVELAEQMTAVLEEHIDALAGRVDALQQLRTHGG